MQFSYSSSTSSRNVGLFFTLSIARVVARVPIFFLPVDDDLAGPFQPERAHIHTLRLTLVKSTSSRYLRFAGCRGVSSSFKLARFYVARHKAIRVTSRQRRCNLGKLLLCEYGCGYFLPVLPSWNIQTLPVAVSSATNDSMSFLIRIWGDRRICFPSSLTCVQSGWLNCCGYSILWVEFSECDGKPFASK